MPFELDKIYLVDGRCYTYKGTTENDTIPLATTWDETPYDDCQECCDAFLENCICEQHTRTLPGSLLLTYAGGPIRVTDPDQIPDGCCCEFPAPPSGVAQGIEQPDDTCDYIRNLGLDCQGPYAATPCDSSPCWQNPNTPPQWNQIRLFCNTGTGRDGRYRISVNIAQCTNGLGLGGLVWEQSSNTGDPRDGVYSLILNSTSVCNDQVVIGAGTWTVS